MSFHKNPKYQIPELIDALKNHGLDSTNPSQLADAFRLGYMAASQERDSLESELAALRAQRVPMTDEQKAELYRADRKDIPVIVDNGVAFLPDWKVKEIIIAFEAFHGIGAKPRTHRETQQIRSPSKISDHA